MRPEAIVSLYPGWISILTETKGRIMRTSPIVLIASVCLALVPGCSRNPSATARIGDPAASLDGLSFVKGGPVKIEPGTIYVVEFWATWCPPCRESIPHLTKVAALYKDKGVVVVGVSVEKEESVVRPFVEKQADKMDYIVALDPDRTVSDLYMKAFAQNTIPHAFLVDGSGKIAWHGIPDSGLEKAIDKALASK
jgi:thiol-disulfide isomerase/thioredoxin